MVPVRLSRWRCGGDLVRKRGLEGTEYVTVLRPTGDRDRYGDLPGLREGFQEGPCMIAWATAWASVKEIVTWPVEATDRDVSLYFKFEPDIDAKDYIELGNRTRYRVVAVEPWKFGRDGRSSGTVVRLSGLEQGA